MKNIVLGALLVGSLASHSAFAEIRTFDFTASVQELRSASGPATSIPGLENGTTISLNEVIQGRVSFDDLGRDWTNVGTAIYNQPVIAFSYTLAGSGTSISVNAPVWSHNPAFLGSVDRYIARGTTPAKSLTSHFTLLTPGGDFNWELAQYTTGTLGLAWSNNNVTANLTSLTEVSPVPEPATYGMMLIGAAIVAGAAKRRARRAA